MRFHRLKVLRRLPHPGRCFTQGLLTENRHQVLCLAHALETHKTLTGDDVLAVLEHRQGPLIDGRPYGDAAFVLRLEVGSPGGGQGGRKKKGQDPEQELRRALADRIEDSLTGLLTRVESILVESRDQVLCLAHALETHKTLSGDDVLAVLEHRQGPLVDGRPYGNAAFVQRLEEYHQGAAAAHRSHSKAPLSLPAAPSPVWVPQDAAVAPPAPDQFGP